MGLFVANAVAQGMANAIAAAVDAGTQAVLRIYSGTLPTDVDAALSGNTLLAELTLSATAFGSATDTNPGARITANPITPDSSADNTGTASCWRVYTQATSGTACLQGTAGLSGTDMILSTTAFTSGSQIAASSMVVNVPRGLTMRGFLDRLDDYGTDEPAFNEDQVEDRCPTCEHAVIDHPGHERDGLGDGSAKWPHRIAALFDLWADRRGWP